MLVRPADNNLHGVHRQECGGRTTQELRLLEDVWTIKPPTLPEKNHPPHPSILPSFLYPPWPCDDAWYRGTTASAAPIPSCGWGVTTANAAESSVPNSSPSVSSAPDTRWRVCTPEWPRKTSSAGSRRSLATSGVRGPPPPLTLTSSLRGSTATTWRGSPSSTTSLDCLGPPVARRWRHRCWDPRSKWHRRWRPPSTTSTAPASCPRYNCLPALHWPFPRRHHRFQRLWHRSTTNKALCLSPYLWRHP